MKKLNKLILIVIAIFAWGTSVSTLNAAEYCQTPITATDGVTTVKLSCQLLSVGNYQIKIESDVVMSGLSGGSFCNINGVGGNQLIAQPGYVLSADGKTITIDIPSSSAPNLYTPLYVMISGEKNFAWPSGITWGVCNAQTDFSKPVMGTAVLVGSPTYNSANVTLSGTDDVTNPVTNYVLNDAANSVTNKVVVTDASGNGIISGLNPGTTYNFTITARDAAFNVSDNSVIIQVITAVRPSQCSGDRGHFGGAAKIHYSIDYVGTDVIYTISPLSAERTLDFAQVQSTVGTNNMTIAADGKIATYTKTGLVAGTSIGVLFMYSFDNTPGNEMTAQSSALTDVNSIYYKVGECAAVVEDDEEAPTAFTATKGTELSTSIELLLNATDNSGSISYTISYGSTPTILSTTGTSATQKSYVVTGLTAETAYTFNIIAKDAAGNAAANNPIEVAATTLAAPVLSTVNFETVGQDWSWTLFENGDNAPALYAVVDNPDATGINNSTKVAKYIVNANGQPWAGLWSNDLVDFTFTADNCMVKVMVNKNVISNFTVKFEGNDGLNFEKQVANTVIDQWEELTFDFSNRIGSSVTRLVIIPDFPSTRTAGSINYFDNISFNSSTGPIVETSPTVAAPTPTILEAKVISLFSNAYTNVVVDTWRTGWSNATYESVQIAGNDTKKYSDLVFVGIETTGANLIDASAMSHLHLDVWTPDVTTFKVKLVDFGANGEWEQNGDNVEHELTFTPTLSTWNSYIIPLADFTGLTTKAHIAQYIFSGAPTGKVFIDNLYFYNDSNTNVSEVSAIETITCYPNPLMDRLTVLAKSEIKDVVVRNLLGQTIKTVSINSMKSTFDLSNMSAGNYFVTVRLASGQISTQKLVKL